jgi:tetratricopeptide (TPR) repeat protein
VTAGLYMGYKMFDEAIDAYQELVKLTPKDPWAWHNMSWMYFQLENYQQAEICNKKALSIMDFGNARKIEKALKEKKGPLGNYPKPKTS